MLIARSKDEDEGANRLNAALNRMNESYILCAFIQKVLPLLVKEGKDDLLPVIVSYVDK